MRTVADADAVAAAAHAGQSDKAGRPAIEHVRAVAAALRDHGEHAEIAGLLHDVVEDTPLTTEELRRRQCPEAVVRAIDAVTRRPDEPYLDMVARAAADPLGRLVKLADNAHNADESRLRRLAPATAERLRRKYAAARQILTREPA
ncbi:HD domain-containing protein [Spiractinospora alimapuensis]|nr:HD domain-containing protein [Spiractinospora alimapuensis]